jgi:DNA polymerase elongation subunit (family B)
MRILTLDIETSPHEAYAFQVWQANIAHGQIKKPTYMLSWAAKFLDEKVGDMVYRDCDAPDFLTKLYDMLTQADIIVSYNGDKFDLKHIKREFIEDGFAPLRPYASVDLLKHVKANFNFPHNKLDYVASVLLGKRKLQTGGFDLWPAFMSGDPKARKVMERYNRGDVKITEALYKFMRPWIKNHPNVGPVPELLGDEDDVYECPCCGSWKTEQKRPRRTRCFAIRQVSCTKCGAWADGKRKKLK